MSAFPTAKHLASRAGICPGNDRSAGERRSGKRRNGFKWLRANLTGAAKAASRMKDTCYRPNTRGLDARRGHARATTAVAHSMLVAARHTSRPPASFASNRAATISPGATRNEPRNDSSRNSNGSATRHPRESHRLRDCSSVPRTLPSIAEVLTLRRSYDPAGGRGVVHSNPSRPYGERQALESWS